MQRIFLDNNSTTPLAPQVFEAMRFDLCSLPRNPSSTHSFGREARNELTKARRQIADYLGVDPLELIFTSGASESNNHLLKGFFKTIFPKKVLSTELEHSSIYNNVLNYQKSGGQVEFLSVDERGAPMAEEIEKHLQNADVGLIVLMAVNNETGVKTDIEAIAQLAERYQVPLIVDAVAWMGKEIIKIHPGVAAMSFSAHKFHGPKGMGLTYLSEKYSIPPLIEGGGQENGQRAGTVNLAGILGLAKAFELVYENLPASAEKIAELRDYFETSLKEQIEGLEVNGLASRVCNTSSLAFVGLDGESLMMALDMQGIACSHGSACSSGSLTVSRVLSKMGLSKERIEGSLRFALSRMTTRDEIERAVHIIVKTVHQMQKSGLSIS